MSHGWQVINMKFDPKFSNLGLLKGPLVPTSTRLDSVFPSSRAWPGLAVLMFFPFLTWLLIIQNFCTWWHKHSDHSDWDSMYHGQTITYSKDSCFPKWNECSTINHLSIHKEAGKEGEESPYLWGFEKLGSAFGCGRGSQGITDWRVNWPFPHDVAQAEKEGRPRGTPCTRHHRWARNLEKLLWSLNLLFLHCKPLCILQISVKNLNVIILPYLFHILKNHKRRNFPHLEWRNAGKMENLMLYIFWLPF